jgi:hypothetical protein
MATPNGTSGVINIKENKDWINRMVNVNQKDSEMILGIEHDLQRILRPVKPRADFIERLENRLITAPQIHIETHLSTGMLAFVVSAIILIISLSWILWRYGIKKLLN